MVSKWKPEPEKSCLAGDEVSSLGHWSLTLLSVPTIGEMVQGVDRLYLLNPSYRHWWHWLHPALVICGRETTLPSEFLVLMVRMLRVESPQRNSMRVTGASGVGGGASLMTVQWFCLLWQKGSHSHHQQMTKAGGDLLGSPTFWSDLWGVGREETPWASKGRRGGRGKWQEWGRSSRLLSVCHAFANLPCRSCAKE